MKLYANLLTLAAITGASAFAPQSPAFARTTSLNEARYSYLGPDTKQKEVVGQDVGESSSASTLAKGKSLEPISSEEMFKTLDTIRVQGDTLRTCSFETQVERVEVLMKTGGRPMNADVELWQGHCNDPQRIKVYMEDGAERTFRVVLETPGSSNSVSIRNTSSQEYPLNAGIEADYGGPSSAGSPSDILRSLSSPRIVQGGAVYTLPFSPAVQSLQVMLQSDGRPMNAKIELLQGPNNVKQTMEVYSENGSNRPLFVIIDSPGSGNVVRIVNTATVEYPLTAYIEPYIVDEQYVESKPKMQWS